MWRGGAAVLFSPSRPTKTPSIRSICPPITGGRRRRPIWTGSPRRLAGEAYFADLKGALLACGEQTYHARDSHWNNLGALQGYNAIMKAAGRPHETYAGEDWEWRRIWEGDLDAMIFPKLGYKDLQAVFSTEWSYTYTSNFHSEEDILIATRNEEAEGSLLVFRDSFSNALLPFLAEQYETAKFSRAVPTRCTSWRPPPIPPWLWRSWSGIWAICFARRR